MLIYIILLTFLIFYIVIRYNRRGRLLRKIRGPFLYPLVGNLPRFAVTSPLELWNIQRKFSNEFYPITRFYGFNTIVISVRHPDDLEILLSSQKTITKGFVYNCLQPWLKTGLLTSTGGKWHQRRKLLTPAFHYNTLKSYLSTINNEALRFTQNLKNEGKETEVDLMNVFQDYTLNVMIESALGVPINTIQRESKTKYENAIHDFGHVIRYRVVRPYIFDGLMKLPWNIANLQRKSLKTLHEFTKNLMQVKMFNKNINFKNEDSNGVTYTENDGASLNTKKLAFLDLLLEARQNNLIDDEGIQEEVDTFTFEGHDTTSMALVFTLMLIAANKEVQERARSEAKEVIESHNGKLEMSDINNLDYINRCIKESLRLYPPVASIMRYSVDELQLKHALVPRNSNIIVHFFDTHRDPNFWPEPNKFDPDRFLPERSVGRHPYAYVPFSAGPRNCIGQKFAMMEMKLLIAHILCQFRLEPVEDLVNECTDKPLIVDIVLRPADKIFIRFIKL